MVNVCKVEIFVNHKSKWILVNDRPGGTGGTLETRLHSFLGIFCHFQKYKAKVCRTNGSKDMADSLLGHIWTLDPSNEDEGCFQKHICNLLLFSKLFALKFLANHDICTCIQSIC